MSLRIIDAHVHPQTGSTVAQILDYLKQKPQLQLYVMGTQPSDWETVAELYRANKQQIVPCFGYHPWFAYQLEGRDSDAWLAQLTEHISNISDAVVWEFFMFKIAGTPVASLQKKDWPRTFNTTQPRLFEIQFDLAVSFQRPVSLHVVQAYGYLCDFLQSRLEKLPPRRKRNAGDEETFLSTAFPPAIMLHSFSGSVSIIEHLTRMRVGRRFFFSFSATVNGRSKRKLMDAIRATPEDRVLVESDLGSVDGIDTSLEEILSIVADAKGWTIEDSVTKTSHNARNYLMRFER